MDRATNGSSTVYKALSVLEALAGLMRRQPDGVSLTELGRQTGFTPSSTFRYLRPRLVLGRVAQDTANGRYRRGVRVVVLAGVFLQ
ncbi:MAG: helix-turn-helix domain-containing protein, partial [Methanocella sp.]